MKLKQLLRNVILLITQPAMAWKFVSRMGNRAAMTSEFLYPMILLACLSTFLGIMHGLFDVAASLTKYLIEQEISKTTTASAFNY